jgi:hypothetical protein
MSEASVFIPIIHDGLHQAKEVFILIQGTFGPTSTPAWQRSGLAGFAAAALLVCSFAAKADPVNLIQNGSFETTTAVTSNGTGTEITNSNLADWNVSSCLAHCDASNPNNTFTFLAPTNVGTNGVYNANQGGTINFWSTPGASPVGGNAVTADAATETALLYQVVSGLKAGDSYTLSFYQATMQATNQAEPFTASWEVGFGDSPAQYSTTMSNPGGTSTGWMEDTLTFTADAAQEALGFFATGSGGDEPPFLLLDGVSLTDSTAVPEPATIGLAMAGLAGVFFARRKRLSV